MNTMCDYHGLSFSATQVAKLWHRQCKQVAFVSCRKRALRPDLCYTVWPAQLLPLPHGVVVCSLVSLTRSKTIPRHRELYLHVRFNAVWVTWFVARCQRLDTTAVEEKAKTWLQELTELFKFLSKHDVYMGMGTWCIHGHTWVCLPVFRYCEDLMGWVGKEMGDRMSRGRESKVGRKVGMEQVKESEAGDSKARGHVEWRATDCMHEKGEGMWERAREGEEGERDVNSVFYSVDS